MRVEGLGFRVEGLGFMGLVCGGWSLGFGVEGSLVDTLGFGVIVWGLEFSFFCS